MSLQFPEKDKPVDDRLVEASAYLKAYEKDPASLYLGVLQGNAYIGSKLVEFVGGDSPEFTAPDYDPRIDLLVLDDEGNLERVEGTEASSPEAPSYPTGKILIAQVYNRVGQTSIKDEDDDSNGYIEKDLRMFIQRTDVDIQVFTSDGTWTKPAGAKSVYVQMWGGGGSGGAVNDWDSSYSGDAVASGGGGGEYREMTFKADDLGSTESVTVGSGGSSASTDNGRVNGNDGENSSFSSCSAGGGGGGQTGSGQNGTEKGGSSGATVVRGHPLHGESDSVDAKRSGQLSAGGGAIVTFGDDKGVYGAGNSVYGGAGGGATEASGGYGITSGGSSQLGGDGGNGSHYSGDNGEARGGGGGGTARDEEGTTVESGAGGRGEVIVTTYF